MRAAALSVAATVDQILIDFRRLTSRIKLTGDKFEGAAPRQSEISLRHGGYVI
jgi:hypothetical protein